MRQRPCPGVQVSHAVPSQEGWSREILINFRLVQAEGQIHLEAEIKGRGKWKKQEAST